MSATLYETVDDRTVWSRRFEVLDRPDAWKSIIQAIYGGFGQATNDVEAARAMRERPDSLDQRDLLFLANTTSLSPLTKENNLAKIALLERALAIDPNYVRALRSYARGRANLVPDGWSSDPDADLSDASRVIDRALQIAPDDVGSRVEKANVLRAQGNWGEAAALLRKVIEIVPLQAMRYRELGWISDGPGALQRGARKLPDCKSARDWNRRHRRYPTHQSPTSPSRCWRTIGFPRRLHRRSWQLRRIHLRAVAMRNILG